VRTQVLDSLQGIPATEWDALVAGGDPFLGHAFLAGLERHGAVGAAWGWLPCHIIVRGAAGELLGAAPLYEKHNGYGELVFDHAWARAYERAGGHYYPKLVAAVPYTPATGQRLLLHPQADQPAVARRLIAAAHTLCRERGCSSLHWLFPREQDAALLTAAGHVLRMDCQYHWHNRGWRDFSDYLDSFTAEKRKKIKRERRRAAEQGISLERLPGDAVSEELWAVWHRFYSSTFDRKSGWATLSEGFFRDLGVRLGARVVLVLARQGRRPVAAALLLRGDHVLYGRHWGCEQEFHSLHFEACYYQGLEYALEQGLAVFEPGAQGEHKLQRGFMPTAVYSAHWFPQAGFQQALDDFLRRERWAVADYMQQCCEHLPYKRPVASAPP
jgi:hypothetical protein